MELVFAVPGADEPGYLIRQRKALKFAQEFEGGATPELLDGLVDFLSEFVEEPSDPKEAKEALWGASENQIMELLGAVSSQGQVPPEASAP